MPPPEPTRLCTCPEGTCILAESGADSLNPGWKCGRQYAEECGVEPPVDPDTSIADAERIDRERREEEIRRANADDIRNPPTPFDDDDEFITTGMVRIWLGFNAAGVQQIRFDWDSSIPTTSVIGACEFLSAVAKARMAGTLE